MASDATRFSSTLIAYGASVAIHVAIVALLVCGGSSSGGAKSASKDAPTGADVETASSAAASESAADLPRGSGAESATSGGASSASGAAGAADSPRENGATSATSNSQSSSRQVSRPGSRAGGLSGASGLSGAGFEEYVVQKGDNLWRIAREYGMTVKELTELNQENLSKDKSLKVGQKIKVKAKEP